jgi:putative Mn2+ efflux pump MntP
VELYAIAALGFGLAMDAVAVSVTSGATLKHVTVKDGLKIGGTFGLFQAIMPLAGWSIGAGLSRYITGVDHWIAFCLLTIIGLKMIHECVKPDEDRRKLNIRDLHILFVLAIATSIDAMVIGLTFAFLGIQPIIPALIIGAITFILSYLGVELGDHFGRYFYKKAEVVGGLVLITIGLKILLEHLIS